MISNAFPKTAENRAALRTAIATVIAIVLAFALHLDKPYWSGMTVVVLANLYTGNILDKAVMRLLGTFFGAWSGFFLAGFIANSFFLYFLMNFFIIAMAVYYYNFSRLFRFVVIVVTINGSNILFYNQFCGITRPIFSL